MKNVLLLTAAALIFFAQSCQKDKAVAELNQLNTTTDIRQYLTDVWGFPADRIIETEDAFIAEGDQVFEKADFWKTYGSASANEFFVDAMQENGEAGDRKHYRSAYRVTSTAEIIVLNVLPNVTSSWRAAIEQAASDWNYADGRFTFIVQYSSLSQLGAVNISMKTMPNTDYAKANYPTSNGYPGNALNINPYYTNLLSHNSKVGVIAHEVGHTIGLRHTDSGLGTLITNVSNTCKYWADPYSVMSAEGDFYYGFTDCDLQAYWALYP